MSCCNDMVWILTYLEPIHIYNFTSDIQCAPLYAFLYLRLPLAADGKRVTTSRKHRKPLEAACFAFTCQCKYMISSHWLHPGVIKYENLRYCGYVISAAQEVEYFLRELSDRYI